MVTSLFANFPESVPAKDFF